MKFFIFGIEAKNLRKMPQSNRIPLKCYGGKGGVRYGKQTRFITRNLSLINDRNFREPEIDYSLLERTDIDWNLFFSRENFENEPVAVR